MFDVEKCTRCGLCLESCPVVELDIDQAKKEIENLIAGSSFIVNECATCGTCDFHCPNKLNPSDLIKELKVKLIQEFNEKGKIPRTSRFLFPFNRSNVFTFYEKEMMSPGEVKNLEKWKSPPNTEELVLLGCSVSYLMQYIYENPTFKGLLQGKVFAGGIDFCCGEVYHRTCMPIEKKEIENRLYSRFSELGVKKLITFCNECYEAYKHEYKKISNEFEVMSIWEYLFNEIEKGNLKITDKLDLKVVFHDACVVKKYPELMEYPRKIVEATGCEIIELEHNHEDALCCGLSCGLLDRKLMEKTRRKRFKEIKKTGSKYVINTCYGCISTFSMDSRMLMQKYKILSVLELLRMSCGEDVDLFENMTRFNDILNTSMALSRKRRLERQKRL